MLLSMYCSPAQAWQMTLLNKLIAKISWTTKAKVKIEMWLQDKVALLKKKEGGK